MVVCLIALPILLILGIFSASHRKLAKEAIKCAVNKVTFRPCDSTLEQKLKKMVVGPILRRNEKLAGVVFKNFGMLSVVFGLLMLFAVFGTAFGIYNFWSYGNCNGPATNEFCVFNPETYSSGIDFFGFRFFETKHTPEEVKPIEAGDVPSIGNPNAPNKIIEVGCFTCPYTKAAEPLVEELLKKYEGKVFFSFKYFPLPNHKYSFDAAVSAECAREQGKFWEYKQQIFEHQEECGKSASTSELKNQFLLIAQNIGLDKEQFNSCIDSGKYTDEVELHKQQGIAAGIYGTPTFFVNDRVLVAPVSVEEFEKFLTETN